MRSFAFLGNPLPFRSLFGFAGIDVLDAYIRNFGSSGGTEPSLSDAALCTDVC